jgi:hypothetical protein
MVLGWEEGAAIRSVVIQLDTSVPGSYSQTKGSYWVLDQSLWIPYSYSDVSSLGKCPKQTAHNIQNIQKLYCFLSTLVHGRYHC